MSQYSWIMKQWTDARGLPQESWDIYEGEKRIVEDLTYREAVNVVTAHNKAIDDAMKEGE